MNKAILSGRLTRDPEVRIPDGDKSQKAARYTLALNRILSNAGKESVDYFNCIAFGAKADFAEKYFHKGIKVLISGRLHSSSYTNREGHKVYVTEIIIDEQEFTESRRSKEAFGSLQGGAR